MFLSTSLASNAISITIIYLRVLRSLQVKLLFALIDFNYFLIFNGIEETEIDVNTFGVSRKLLDIEVK